MLGARGVQRLAGAILVQAIQDLSCGAGRRKIDALHWVQDPGEDQFSFNFCCRMLNRKPRVLRRLLLEQSAPGWMPHETVETGFTFGGLAR